MKELIDKLLLQQNLTKEESSLAIQQALSGANPAQIAAFLVLMRVKGTTVEELHGAILAMQKYMVAFPLSYPVLDIAGTGGDGMHTLNISTASAILAASCGVKVAKHGNRSVSSSSGSADVLEALGVSIHASLPQIKHLMEEIGISFLFAPNFHPALREFKEIRKGLNMRTFFNIIAPLLNPTGAKYLMVGVFRKELMEVVAELLVRLNTEHSLVFHGCGLDEISCAGPADVIEVKKGEMKSFIIDPQELGFARCSIEDLKGQDANYNATKIVEAFEGKKSAFADTIVLNAGIAVYLYGLAETIGEGIEIAKENLASKRALNILNKWKTYA